MYPFAKSKDRAPAPPVVAGARAEDVMNPRLAPKIAQKRAMETKGFGSIGCFLEAPNICGSLIVVPMAICIPENAIARWPPQESVTNGRKKQTIMTPKISDESLGDFIIVIFSNLIPALFLSLRSKPR
jgi:hypothetical protein